MKRVLLESTVVPTGLHGSEVREKGWRRLAKSVVGLMQRIRNEDVTGRFRNNASLLKQWTKVPEGGLGFWREWVRGEGVRRERGL